MCWFYTCDERAGKQSPGQRHTGQSVAPSSYRLSVILFPPLPPLFPMHNSVFQWYLNILRVSPANVLGSWGNLLPWDGWCIHQAWRMLIPVTMLFFVLLLLDMKQFVDKTTKSPQVSAYIMKQRWRTDALVGCVVCLFVWGCSFCCCCFFFILCRSFNSL